MGHIFISYSRVDQDYTQRLGQDIRNHGFDVWMDDRIDFGDRWWKTIVKAIQECSACVVVMSPDAEHSEWVEREILLAQREKKPIFPVLLRGKEMPLLITSQYHDVRHGGMPGDDFYERLRRVMQGQVPVGMTGTFPKPATPIPPSQPPAQSPQAQFQASASPAAQPASPAWPLVLQPPQTEAQGKRRKLYLVLGAGVLVMIMIICGVIALATTIMDGDDGNNNRNNSNGGVSENAVENAEKFIKAVGQGNLDTAGDYVCQRNSGSLPNLVRNTLELAYGVTLGVDSSLDNPSCFINGQYVSCNYALTSIYGWSSALYDTFIIEDDKVCDVAIQ